MAVTRAFAAEDGDLNSVAITTARTKSYSDIDLTFTAKPSGDVYKKTDAGAVKQAVKNLLLTSHYEKPFMPFYGGNLNSLLFELASDPVVQADLKDNLMEQIELYEPRARVTNVVTSVEPDNYSVFVQVFFTVISTNEEVVLETTISRLR